MSAIPSPDVWTRLRAFPSLWLISAMVMCFFLWSVFFDLDVASHAQGQVITAGQLKRVQHLEGGIVKGIRVAEGQKIAQGEVMAEMASVVSSADVSELKMREAGLEAQSLRLSAILAQKPQLALPTQVERDYPAIAADARASFRAYQERFNDMLRTHESRIAQRRAEIDEARERFSGLQSRSKLIAEQVRISEQLLKQKLTNEYEHLQLRRDQAQIDADRDTTLASQQRAVRALEEAQAALAAFRSEETLTLRQELQTVSTDLASVRERLRKPEDSSERTLVKSPVDGVVMTLYVKNSGAVVPPGGLIATVVPAGDVLMVEVRLPIAEVGHVRQGDPAKLSLAGGSGGFSGIDAKVVFISPDATTDEKTGQNHYVVRLEPAQFMFERAGEKYPLKPGVPVMATILTGYRSVFHTLADTFLSPGIKPLSER